MKKRKSRKTEPDPPAPDRKACPACLGSGVCYNGTDSLKCVACNGQGFVGAEPYRSVNDPEVRQ